MESMPRTDLEEDLRRTLHAWLDATEPPRGPAPVRSPRFRAASGGAFGLVGVAVVLVALLVVPRLVPGPATPGATSGPGPFASDGIFAGGRGGSPVQSGVGAAVTGPGTGATGRPEPGALATPAPNATSGAPATGVAVAPGSTAVPPPGSVAPPVPSETPGPVKNASPPTPTLVPIATPRPTTGPTGAPAIAVSLADNGSIVTLSVGQALTLQLGGAYAWKVTVGNPSVLVPAPGATAAQPSFIAAAPGLTRLVAAGDPTCRDATPPCGAPSIALEITVVVH
jgi:hypothetical protein